MRAFAGWLFVALILAGCADREEKGGVVATSSAAPTATEVEQGSGGVVQPPSAYLEDLNGNAIEGGIGTYCWRQGSMGVCIDFAGPRTNSTPIAVAASARLEFVFDAGTPDEVKLDWAPEGDMTGLAQGATLDWSPKDGANYRGPQYTDSREAPAEAGVYVLSVFTRFPEGDVSYGFYVEVE